MDKNEPLEVLSAVSLSEAQVKLIKAQSPAIHLSVYNDKDATTIPAEIWEKAEVLLTSGRFMPEPAAVPNLRWLQVTFAGVDRVLDCALLHEPRIMTTSGSGAGVSQMGEYVIMALLMLGHKLPEAIAGQKERKWISNMTKSIQPLELRGSTVGIVGYGSIGREVARLLNTFGAKVLAAKHNAMQPEDDGYTPKGLGDPQGNYFHRLYPIEGLKGMLEECDFVVLTLPLSPDTHHMFSTDLFNAMKTGTYLVNVSRGALIDDAALIQAIKAGKVGGAVLDVFDPEPLPADSPLWALPEVILTPHISGISPNLMDGVVTLFSENLKRYLAGETLFNIVDVEKGY